MLVRAMMTLDSTALSRNRRLCMRQRDNFDELPAVAQWLYSARTRAGKSQEQVALAADIDTTYVSKIELGQKNPSRKVVTRLAKALVLNPDDPAAVSIMLEEGLQSAGFVSPIPKAIYPMMQLAQQIVASVNESGAVYDLTPEQAEAFVTELEDFGRTRLKRITKRADATHLGE